MPNTKAGLMAGNAYRIFVRGNRSINLADNSAIPSATTLRVTGTLVTGPVVFAAAGGTTGMPALSNAVNDYSYIANPYASSVNWLAVMATSTNLSSSMYIFDPTINGRGGYVTYSGILQANNTSGSLIGNDLQSGQGFFVQTTGFNPILTFREAHKSAAFLPVFKTTSTLPHINIDLLLPEQLGTASSADGTAVYFSEAFSSAIGNEDSYKFTNQDENIAIVRDGQILSLEGRKNITGPDSIPLKVWQLTQKQYYLKITLSNFAINVQGYLKDKYLNTSLPLSDGLSQVPFSITADAASIADDRFKVVFQISAKLPVNLTALKAYEKNKGVQVEWTAASESDVDRHQVERSLNGQQFETIGSIKAKNASGVSTVYNFFDETPSAGTNYYRIKSLDKSGVVKQSEVVRASITPSAEGIMVSPNPVSGNTINVVFNGVEKGLFTVNLISVTGQTVYKGTINHSGGSGRYIMITRMLQSGVYQLLLSTGDKVESVPVVKQ